MVDWFSLKLQFKIVPPDTKSIPPYVPHRTFTTFLELLSFRGIPDRIDRSVFDSRFSGSAASQISSALRSLKLVDTDGKPRQALVQLVNAKGEERRRGKAAILREVYKPLFKLDLAHATRRQLRTALREFGTTDSMLVKCEAFFIQAAQDAGIPLSHHILSHRTRAVRTRRQAPSSSSDSAPVAPVSREEAKSSVANDAPDDAAGAAILLTLAEKVLEKYPNFDPTWSREAQENWMSGLERLSENVISKLGIHSNEGGSRSK